MPVWDPWDRDQWGRVVPGHCIRYAPVLPTAQIIQAAYVTEDGFSAFYTSEDGTAIYVPE